jgi:pyrimidine oxygenase
MRELWETGRSDLKGDFFQMDDCRCLPLPAAKIHPAGGSPARQMWPTTISATRALDAGRVGTICFG